MASTTRPDRTVNLLLRRTIAVALAGHGAADAAALVSFYTLGCIHIGVVLLVARIPLLLFGLWIWRTFCRMA